MTKKLKNKKKNPLSPEDVVLLNKVLSALNCFLYFAMGFEIGTTRTAKYLELRLKIIKKKLGLSQATIEMVNQRLGKGFFEEFGNVLEDFVRKEGLGVEFNKRLASELLLSVKARIREYEMIASR